MRVTKKRNVEDILEKANSDYDLQGIDSCNATQKMASTPSHVLYLNSDSQVRPRHVHLW